MIPQGLPNINYDCLFLTLKDYFYFKDYTNINSLVVYLQQLSEVSSCLVNY